MTEGDADDFFKGVKVYVMDDSPETQERLMKLDNECRARLQRRYEERDLKIIKAHKKLLRDGPWLFCGLSPEYV